VRKRLDLAERRSEIRDQIRAAAIAEFADCGLAGASTQRIADRAGLSKTRLHYYISSKEDLYEEALEHVTGAWVDLFDDIPTGASPRTFVASWIDRKLRYCIKNPDHVRLFVSEVMRGGPMLIERFSRSRDSMRRAAALIVSWVEAGLIRPVDPVLLQFHIWAMTEHYAVRQTEVNFMLELEPGQTIDIEHVVSEMTDLVLSGVEVHTHP
jgi:TetR/AcrR family transcriptional regulator